ncbi:membrane protein [Gordonia phage SpeedDemon]|nr:membrane protein [Gordonia phage SpeedDemon]
MKNRAKIAAASIAAAGLLPLVIGCGIIGGYANKAGEVVGVENVETQHTQIIERFSALQDAANNACAAGQTNAGNGGPLLVEDPALAYAATYFNIRTDYNRRMANIFEAKIVAPSGYPKEIPAFPQAKAGGDWCAVAEKIAELQK